MKLKNLDSEELVYRLRDLVKSERSITAEVIEYIQEVDARKLFLDFGHTNTFSFLTRELGYSESAAMRRLSAARFSREIPEIKEAIEDGSLNLSQVSLLASSIRAKQKQDPSILVGLDEKRDLLDRLKSQDLKSSEKIIATGLDLPIRVQEKKHYQKDNSVRLEITLSEQQMNELNRVKEIISHQNPNPTVAELVSFLARAFLKSNEPKRYRKVTAGAVVGVRTKKRPYIPRHVKQKIFQRDRFCQWRDQKTGQVCASRFQLQLDHRQPVWAGGGSSPENLQLLCSVHNMLKYEKELEATSLYSRAHGP